MAENVDKLYLKVVYYDIAEDGTTLIEISVHNYKEIIKKEEDEYSLASPFDKQTYLSDALLLSIYSKIYSEKTASKQPFFTPLEFYVQKETFSKFKSLLKMQGRKILLNLYSKIKMRMKKKKFFIN